MIHSAQLQSLRISLPAAIWIATLVPTGVIHNLHYLAIEMPFRVRLARCSVSSKLAYSVSHSKRYVFATEIVYADEAVRRLMRSDCIP